jgi:hypothetical protein
MFPPQPSAPHFMNTQSNDNSPQDAAEKPDNPNLVYIGRCPVCGKMGEIDLNADPSDNAGANSRLRALRRNPEVHLYDTHRVRKDLPCRRCLRARGVRKVPAANPQRIALSPRLEVRCEPLSFMTPTPSNGPGNDRAELQSIIPLKDIPDKANGALGSIWSAMAGGSASWRHLVVKTPGLRLYLAYSSSIAKTMSPG